MRVALLLLALPLALAQSATGQTKGPRGGRDGRGEEPVVRVAQGQLRGLRIERSPGGALRTLYAFRGVPYARPPVGSRRFQDPEEAEGWTGIRNATAYGSICVQKILDTGNVTGEEDCLFLNVFTADPPNTWRRVKRPVIVYLHGGAFVQWSGNVEGARPDPLLREGIVYVTLNYRLGVLGFLNTEDSQAPGNAALKDQLLALRWVQRNIAVFGGDRDKVTLMGESAGAACVHLHMLSPRSAGLFHRGIAVSGTALIPAAGGEQMRRYALALRQRYNASCPNDAPDAIVRCLQRIDAQDLVFNQYDIPREPFQNYFLANTFLPSVEVPGSSNTPFLTTSPEQLMREGRYTRMPFMTGFTSAEGLLAVALGGLLTDPSRWAEIDDNFADIYRWSLPPGRRTRENALRARRFYLGDRSLRDAPNDPETVQRFMQLNTDLSIAVGAVMTARLLSENGTTAYLYEFSRDGPIAFIKDLWLNASHIAGVTHGDDMAYLFDFANTTSGELLPVPASEQPLRERQAKLFAYMAKTGHPTPPGSGLRQWPPYSADRGRYMDIGEELRVLPRALGERIDFWRQLIDGDEGQQQQQQTAGA